MKHYIILVLVISMLFPLTSRANCYETVWVSTSDCPLAAYLSVTNTYTYNPAYPPGMGGGTCIGNAYCAPQGFCMATAVSDHSFASGFSFGYTYFIIRGSLIYYLASTPVGNPTYTTPYGPIDAYMFCSSCY